MGPLEYLYYLGWRADTAWKLTRARRLPVPVVSVGNITTGGTGKTPATIALAAEAVARGITPCILTRGYRGRVAGPVFVSAEMYEADVGDEPLLMAEALPGVPVVKGADRFASGLFALERLDYPPGLFILDDGFQHRRLARDVDVVLVNARDPFGNGRLLPSGRLREPLSGLGRAHAVVLTKSGYSPGGLRPDGHDHTVAAILRENPGVPVFFAGHHPTCVRMNMAGRPSAHRAGHTIRREPLSWLSGKGVYAVSGIAEPGAFHEMLSGSRARVLGTAAFSDHHRFAPADVERVSSAARASGADWIITTEKDIMRLRSLVSVPDNWVALGIDFAVEEGFFDLVFGRVTQARS